MWYCGVLLYCSVIVLWYCVFDIIAVGIYKQTMKTTFSYIRKEVCSLDESYYYIDANNRNNTILYTYHITDGNYVTKEIHLYDANYFNINGKLSPQWIKKQTIRIRLPYIYPKQKYKYIKCKLQRGIFI